MIIYIGNNAYFQEFRSFMFLLSHIFRILINILRNKNFKICHATFFHVYTSSWLYFWPYFFIVLWALSFQSLHVFLLNLVQEFPSNTWLFFSFDILIYFPALLGWSKTKLIFNILLFHLQRATFSWRVLGSEVIPSLWKCTRNLVYCYQSWLL